MTTTQGKRPSRSVPKASSSSTRRRSSPEGEAAAPAATGEGTKGATKSASTKSDGAKSSSTKSDVTKGSSTKGGATSDATKSSTKGEATSDATKSASTKSDATKSSAKSEATSDARKSSTTKSEATSDAKKSSSTKPDATKSSSTKSDATSDATSSAPASPRPPARLGPPTPASPHAAPRGRLSDDDLFLFHEGTHLQIYEHFGAHPSLDPDRPGIHFAVWAPNARSVAVIGDFNEWNPHRDLLRRRGDSGVWECFVAGARAGDLYKYRIVSEGGEHLDKADPVAQRAECPPQTASVVGTGGEHRWGDQAWMERRARGQALDRPISIYEVHLGSWMRIPEEGNRWLTYRELAPRLSEYVLRMGFTHVELLPLAEHPFYGSWGYQTTGYFAATARYGAPEDLMHLIDTLHRHGIGVILDWVPAHFPGDEHALARFDGTCVYEHADPRRGHHPDWNTLIFNYGRPEVRSFLLSSAFFWLDKFHVDGLRVDAVASMLYLDYSRREGEWIPNEHGGRENLEAIDLLRRLNTAAEARYPGVHIIAEESTAWPLVSRPVEAGGLGFHMKWDMGWMHDTLRYFGRDPLHRRYHHREINFRMVYAWAEDFVLPLSHDEVVHGKRSLLGKMHGDPWQRFAHLRLLLGHLYASPGKKLLFMGGEFGQEREWNHDQSLDWHLLERPEHRGIQALVAALNRLYADEPALHELDHDPEGFAWIDADDEVRSVATFLRLARQGAPILVALNFTPVPRSEYVIGVPCPGTWEIALSTDDVVYGGSGTELRTIEADPGPWQGMPALLRVTVPPLGAVFLRGPRSGWERALGRDEG